jgi:hypothetical protein
VTVWTLGTAVAVAIVRAGDGPSLIINRDLTNQILIGDSSSVGTSGYVGESIIDPLGTMTVTGLVDIWAVAAAGNPRVDVQQNALAWTASPAQIAAQITLSGVFVVNNSSVIKNTPPQTVPGSSTLQLAPVMFNQIGYEIIVGAKWNAIPLDDFAFGMQLDWSDNATGQIVATDTWFPGAAGSASINPLKTQGQGPTKGNKLTITLINNDPIRSLSVPTLIVMANSRTYEKDEWIWQNANSVTFDNYTSVASLNSAYILAELSFTVLAGATNSYACGLFPGRVTGHYLETSLGLVAPYGIVVYKVLLAGVANSNLALNMFEPDGYFEFQAPRFPVAFQAHNKHATISTASRLVMIGGS